MQSRTYKSMQKYCAYLQIRITDRDFVSVLDSICQLIEEWVRPHVDVNKIGECQPGFEPYSAIGIIQSFDEGGLQLWEERFEQNPGFVQEASERVKYCRFHRGPKSVAQNANERTRDVNDGRFKSVCRG
jgi:hypothetical protein